MWIARFRLRDEEDIYSPLCKKYKIDFLAKPHTHYEKHGKINLIVGGIISGSEEDKQKFLVELKKDKRVKKVEIAHEFILIHAQHLSSREIQHEIKVFYNPQYIIIKPVKVAKDGWEYWEVGCLDRNELNKLISAAVKHYQGELFSIKQEKVKSITSLEFTPLFTKKQFEALKLAFERGYYNYPRRLTLPELAKGIKRSYTTFQEHLRKAENKLISYYLKYR
ncbi:MAG: helix-turn-helix domain-containing protein [Candidatus Woesearchaeota archaeon]|nr:helix-turn-helix domain-containing protein [Candidatus Woesearchaeota archaeon]